MATIQEKSIKLKAVVGEPKGYIHRAIQAGAIKTDKDGLPEDGQAVPLAVIIGRARAVGEHGRSRQDPSTGAIISTEKWPILIGDFECIPTDASRDTHRAPRAFLADHLIESIGTVLADLRREGEIDPIVEVAVKVEAVTNAESASGFVYRWTPLREQPPQHDPMAEMRKLALEAVKPATAALPKPDHDVAKGGKSK